MKIWKIAVAIWLTLVLIVGFLLRIPMIPILEETARNLFLHVPMWMTMSVCFFIGVVHSLRYLSSENIDFDIKAASVTKVGVIFGICGLLTGSLWARFTWGTWWTFAEPKINMSAMAMMIYVGYFVLRSAFTDEKKRAKVSAVFNIFAATTIPFLLYIIPRQLPSLHPGADGNPAFSDMTAPELRVIFYPAVIGFIGLGMWLYDLTYRTQKLEYKHQQNKLQQG
ncbi:MAG: cytochrome c biogenesis protein CcsA [Balneolales bacterium]|nr:cytochrome c biogenesis protein CcsA [Balneolales bacterium]